MLVTIHQSQILQPSPKGLQSNTCMLEIAPCILPKQDSTQAATQDCQHLTLGGEDMHEMNERLSQEL